jgi:hypothetical protein
VGTVFSFALGYYLGVKAGPKAFEELLAAWEQIRSSDEVRDLLSGGVSVLRDVLQQGGTFVAGRLSGGEAPFPRAA